MHFLQRKYSLGSFNLLGHTAPAQAASLLLLGPFLDYLLTGKRVDTFGYGVTTVVSTCWCFITYISHIHGSCTISYFWGLLPVLSWLIFYYYYFFFFAPFAIAVFHYPVMHHCYWNQPQPIHLHRKVYSSVIPSAWAHENHPCLNFGILLLWKRRPQFPCSFWDHSSCRYDLVWECFVKTRGKRAPKLCTAH